MGSINPVLVNYRRELIQNARRQYLERVRRRGLIEALRHNKATQTSLYHRELARGAARLDQAVPDVVMSEPANNDPNPPRQIMLNDRFRDLNKVSYPSSAMIVQGDILDEVAQFRINLSYEPRTTAKLQRGQPPNSVFEIDHNIDEDEEKIYSKINGYAFHNVNGQMKGFVCNLKNGLTFRAHFDEGLDDVNFIQNQKRLRLEIIRDRNNARIVRLDSSDSDAAWE